ncbi:MAG: RsmE family RNA methyltransferase [Patescibacteria group bacterium]
MVPNRFYVNIDLSHDFWLHDADLIAQIHSASLQVGNEVVLFDGNKQDRLYKLVELKDNEAHLQLVTDFELKLPARKVYLLWPLLPSDQNNQLLQKCTALGVSHFMPLLADNGEQTDFDTDSAKTLVTKSAEKGEWSVVPTVREPMHLTKALQELTGKAEFFVCEQGEESEINPTQDHIGILIVPINGWSQTEAALIKSLGAQPLRLTEIGDPVSAASSCVKKIL